MQILNELGQSIKPRGLYATILVEYLSSTYTNTFKRAMLHENFKDEGLVRVPCDCQLNLFTNERIIVNMGVRFSYFTLYGTSDVLVSDIIIYFGKCPNCGCLHWGVKFA